MLVLFELLLGLPVLLPRFIQVINSLIILADIRQEDRAIQIHFFQLENIFAIKAKFALFVQRVFLVSCQVLEMFILFKLG